MSDGSRLCLACGLCCDGTVFEHVDLKAAEAGEAARRLPVVDEPRPRFHQPCPTWSQAEGCTMYDDRPSPCISYRCRTLGRVEDEGMPVEGGVAVVQRARGLAQQAWSQLPTDYGEEALYVASSRFLRSPGGRRPSAQAALMAVLLELAEVLMRDFDVAASGPGRSGGR